MSKFKNFKIKFSFLLKNGLLIKSVKVPALTNLKNTKRPNTQKYGVFHIGYSNLCFICI